MSDSSIAGKTPARVRRFGDATGLLGLAACPTFALMVWVSASDDLLPGAGPAANWRHDHNVRFDVPIPSGALSEARFRLLAPTSQQPS